MSPSKDGKFKPQPKLKLALALAGALQNTQRKLQTMNFRKCHLAKTENSNPKPKLELALWHWWQMLTRIPEENPSMSFRNCHLQKPENSNPNRHSNSLVHWQVLASKADMPTITPRVSLSLSSLMVITKWKHFFASSPVSCVCASVGCHRLCDKHTDY